MTGDSPLPDLRQDLAERSYRLLRDLAVEALRGRDPESSTWVGDTVIVEEAWSQALGADLGRTIEAASYQRPQVTAKWVTRTARTRLKHTPTIREPEKTRTDGSQLGEAGQRRVIRKGEYPT